MPGQGLSRSVAWIGLAIAAGCGPALADNDRSDSRVITYVCKVDIIITKASGDQTIGTSCLDGMRYCNETPGLGYCAPGGQRSISRTCAWVGLGMCRSK